MDNLRVQLFVVPHSNSLPTTGSTQDLAASQFGIFRQDYTPATSGNASGASYLYLAQGRNVTLPGVGTRRSDKIYKANITEYYKVTASPTAAVQITDITDFSAKCGETVSISFRLFSSYINTGWSDGLTRTVTVVTPCCDCGSSPCDNVDISDLVNSFVTKINEEPRLSQFLIAEHLGTGDNSYIRVTAKALTVYGERCDPSAFPYEWDRMFFRTYAYRGPATSQEYNVYDSCDLFATATIVQNATYAQGSPQALIQMEKNYNSYDNTHKHLFKWDIFNNAFQSMVDTAYYYDLYCIKFKDPQSISYQDVSVQDEMVIVAVPSGEGSSIQTILNNFSGLTFTDDTTTNPTTTTTSSTTTTTTTLP